MKSLRMGTIRRSFHLVNRLLSISVDIIGASLRRLHSARLELSRPAAGLEQPAYQGGENRILGSKLLTGRTFF